MNQIHGTGHHRGTYPTTRGQLRPQSSGHPSGAKSPVSDHAKLSSEEHKAEQPENGLCENLKKAFDIGAETFKGTRECGEKVSQGSWNALGKAYEGKAYKGLVELSESPAMKGLSKVGPALAALPLFEEGAAALNLDHKLSPQQQSEKVWECAGEVIGGVSGGALGTLGGGGVGSVALGTLGAIGGAEAGKHYGKEFGGWLVHH